nr:EOG090X00SQ [Eurycercus lamellatus]
MLSRSLHQQIFNTKYINPISDETLTKIKTHLTAHKLWGHPTPLLPEVDLQLPKLLGNNIAEHFEKIATMLCSSYHKKLQKLIAHGIPEIPQHWNFATGWTRYGPNEEVTIVDFPDEDAYIFDVEVCVQEGHAPTLATAVSNNYWYSWCSNQLFDHKERTVLNGLDRHYGLKNLINLETKTGQEKLPLQDQKERIVIGHNVSYDRARVKEQYFIEGTKLRFLDTMSMHIAVSGITSYQRNILMAGKGARGAEQRVNKAVKPWKVDEILEWKNVSSFNGLNDVHKLYCGGLSLDKEKRNIFVTGSLSDIKSDFQNLVTYCAKDTQATFKVLAALLPEYQSRFPHPVTLAGMLEMGSSFLPVNRNWQRYLADSEDAYQDLENELTRSLKREADRACHFLKDEAYRNDPWLWDLDWSVQPLKIKKAPKAVKKNKKGGTVETTTFAMEDNDKHNDEDPDFGEFRKLENQLKNLIDTKTLLFKKPSFLPGYPGWYRSLCDRQQDGLVGPVEISTSAQVVPKLLKLTWDGYPLHHCRELGWGYLVPGRPIEYCRKDVDSSATAFPLKEALAMFPPRAVSHDSGTTKGIITCEEAMRELHQMTESTADPFGLAALREAFYSKKETDDSIKDEGKEKKTYFLTQDRPAWHQGIGPYDVGIPGCWFFRLPHKSGVDNNVGNPLAKDFLNKIEDGTLKATSSTVAEHVLKLNRNIIYWRNARDRITSQMVVGLQQSQLPNSVIDSEHYDPDGSYGAIVPQVITSGTLTRRAVESTWMTASNAYKDRLGSELKAMVQCPPGFNMVGADVDSQELWIASLIGDSHFAGQHGSTAFGWMTLQGKKNDGTDMHSRTASAVSISRDQAKVLNYGRIYGAGERFAKTLLMQFNHRLTEEEALEKARTMYSITKGDSAFLLNHRGRKLAAAVGLSSDLPLTREQLMTARRSARKMPGLSDVANCSIEELTERRIWVGGTESHMFNKLEEIAQSDSPETPVLHCRISRALEPRNVGREFMTSRVNWVVQSSAVDYLHLMVVAMRYLCDLYKIEGRFCISIHDEVRYLVKEEDKFRAALALQITNLWTRCMFAHQLNINDLPQAVAFFSSVDIDTVLRKETDMDCQTPSNPYGLRQGYGVPFGSSYDIYQIVEKTRGSLEP